MKCPNEKWKLKKILSCRFEKKSKRSFSDGDGDGDENVKTAISLLSKTTSLYLHHAFFLYISLPVLHDYDVKMRNFTFYGGRKQATMKFSFSF